MANDRLILNRYRPISEAGVGGFGTVQVAWDTRIQRKVAIKCIELDEADAQRAALPGADAVNLPRYDQVNWDDAPNWDDAQPWDDAPASPHVELPPWEDPSAPADFVSPYRTSEENTHNQVRSMAHIAGLDEARTAAMLSDANIVGVYDFEVQGKIAYLIMEYIEGITLTKLLRDYGDYLTLDTVAAVFSSIAHALEVAHTNQVLHLDIKPDNVLINRQGQVKVTDFGLAKLADASGFGAAGGGTIGYMPLEQMRGENLDARCDEWALASVAYEMLVGNNPFLASDLEHAEKAIEEAELVLPSLCWDELDAEVDDVVFYALDPDREARYDNVVDFAEEMEKFLGDAKRGHRDLAVIVGDAQDDGTAEEFDAEAAPAAPRVLLRDRIGPVQLKVAAHVVGALGSALVGFVALANIPVVSGWANPLFWGLLALVVLAGALKPHLGALLSFVALGVALVVQGAPVVGIVLLVAVATWWFFFGRHGNAAANTLLSVPLAGALGGSQLAPLMAGLMLSPASAAVTAVFAFIVATILAGFGSGSLMGWEPLSYWQLSAVSPDTPAAVIAAARPDLQTRIVNVLAQPETWCIAGSWVLAALAQSACRLRVSRLFDVLGTLAAFAALAAGACLGAWLASGQTDWLPTLPVLIPTVVVGIVGIVLATQLPCERLYEDNLPSEELQD